MGKRFSLTIRDVDEAVIVPYLTEGTPASDVLRRWASQHGQVDEIKSEADALRVLLRVGAEALQERVLDAGYAELASELITARPMPNDVPRDIGPVAHVNTSL